MYWTDRHISIFAFMILQYNVYAMFFPLLNYELHNSFNNQQTHIEDLLVPGSGDTRVHLDTIITNLIIYY